jgi:hypothetical protein
MKYCVRALVGCLALVLGGCSSINNATFRDMSAAYRSVLEEYSNDNVLLNVVRASKRMPVSFLDMPSIVGTGSVMGTAGVSSVVASANPGSLPGFFTALSTGGTSSYAPNLSLSVNTGFNFTQSSLDNAAFMRSFLTDITVDTVAALSNNAVAPPEVLYSLIIDSIEVRNQKDEVVLIANNNPMDPDYATKFQKILYTLVEVGLTTEMSITKEVLSPPMSAADVTRQFGLLANAFTQPGFAFDVIKKSGSPDMYQAVKMAPKTAFCFNKQLTGAVLGKVLADSAYCKSVGIYKGITSTVNTNGALKDETVGVVMHLRSTRTVFDYLGLLVAMQELSPPKYVNIKSLWSASKPSSDQDNPAYPLFIVNKDAKSGSVLSSVNYDGARYSIPSDTKSWTKYVLVS